ncbi:MAG: DUF5060 domain-containing protein [Planctomicrobium sp.]|nr:DUF5060 domain-containing protein [Planctomicrobium sp.]
MKPVLNFGLLILSCGLIQSFCIGAEDNATVVFQESDGIVAVEAEHFARQTKTEKRKFYLSTADITPDISPDGDPNHVPGASGGAYLEILPDTRRTHADKLIKGANFSPSPGEQAVLHYRVHFKSPGRYYVWVRAYSTGSEDNGLHVGLDGEWPESGQRLQWCAGKQSWWWESKQRTEKEHCGEPHKIYLDIDKAGEHTISFSMREDGFEFDKWLMTKDKNFKRPSGIGPASVVHSGQAPEPFPFVKATFNAGSNEVKPTLAGGSPTVPVSKLPLVFPREENGYAQVDISGEHKLWHKVTFTLDGPFANQFDNSPNPFTDYRMTLTCQHASGKKYVIPGYFAADGDAANSSAQAGIKWRAHFVPDLEGEWKYVINFVTGENAALNRDAKSTAMKPFDGVKGTFTVSASDKTGRDLRAHGMLNYVDNRYLKFAGSGKYFLKAGADAPETLLGYADFDDTVAGNAKRVPLKTFKPHLQDWHAGDPTWKDGKGKGLIGAINYLSGKGCNAFSFLTYNAGGDGDNVWPFVERNDKLHYDCSKLNQWGIVFDHGTAKGMYLHFKMQETENDDHRKGKGKGNVPESLDGGKMGLQRKLYCRELIARFGHNLALNWNLGEENTQSTEEQQAMINYITALDPYSHPIVLHSYPNEQDQRYLPLIGDKSKLAGLSLQNSGIQDTHWQTVKWVEKSTEAGKPWIVAFDESGTAAHAQCPDLGYKGYDGHDKDGKMTYTENEVRQQTLWGTLMAGGAGVEYYFGYKYVENDLVCEDWRSRDRSWDYCRIALDFFAEEKIPFWEMQNHDKLVGNPKHDNSKYCFAKPDDIYLVYLPKGGSTEIDLSDAKGIYAIQWFNPRTGAALVKGSVGSINGAEKATIGTPPEKENQDWLAVIRKALN